MVKIMYDDFECSELGEGEQTRWFKITTGFKQGCVMKTALNMSIRRVIFNFRPKRKTAISLPTFNLFQ